MDNESIPSLGIVKKTLWLMIPQYAIPFYMLLIWLTPELLRVYWAAVWFIVPVGLHILNPTAGIGLGGSDYKSDNDLQHVMKVVRDSVVVYLAIAGTLFLVLTKATT